jgi:hypothetical protein
MSTEFDWLDEEPAEKAKSDTTGKAKKRRVKKGVRKIVKIEAGKKIDHEPLRGRVMFQAVKGRKRTWACDGQYVFFRRKNCYGVTPEGRTETNHVAIQRHEQFINNGDYEYVETQDDVEICKINPQSAFFRKGLYMGELDDAAVRRTVAVAACKRDWVLYVDALTELSGRIKAQVADRLAPLVYQDALTYIEVMIAQRGGPTPQECAAGLQNVRVKRGEGSGRVIMLPGGRA